MRIRQSLPQPSITQMAQRLGAGVRDGGAIPGRGLMLAAKRWLEGMWGRRLWWEMPVGENRAAKEARQYCRVMHRGGATTIASLPSLSSQHWQLNDKEAGPSNAWCANLQSRTSDWGRWGALYVLDALNNRKEPKVSKPSKCLNGRSYEESLAKEAFWLLAKEAWKDFDRATTPAGEAVCVPAHLAPPGSPKAKQLNHLHAQLSLEQSCHSQKKSCTYACRVASVVSNWTELRLWPARLLCQREGFSRQEYWSVLSNTGCYTLLEHCISCCPSRQLPWVPGAARIPVTQVAVPPPHLAFTGANPSPPGKPQEQTLVNHPHAEVAIKPQLKPRGSVAKKEDPKPSDQRYKLQIKSTRSTRQTLCLWNT